MNFALRAIRNWRTTVMGIGSIMTGVGDLLGQLGHGHFQSENLGPDVTAILLGFGFLFARDSAVSEQDHRVDRMIQAQVADKVEENRAVLAETIETAGIADRAKVQEQIRDIHEGKL